MDAYNMNRVITYTDRRMTKSANICHDSALAMGATFARIYFPENLSQDFVDFNKEIFEYERGAGCYWLFKPYIIYKAMLDCPDDHIIIYSDAGVRFVNSVKHIIDRMDEDIFFFTNGHNHFEWCKADVWRTMIPVSKIEADFKQVQASVIFFKVNKKTRDFVKEWLLWCQMPGFIDDSPSKVENVATFREHRHDQAILTCLQIKHGYKLHWWPTQYSEHIRVAGDDYPVIFDHHRRRNSEYQSVCV